MKRFLISVLTALTLSANSFACGWSAPERYYMFCFCSHTYGNELEESSRKFWKDYTGEDWSSFNSQKKAAQKKGDSEMLAYIEKLEIYEGICRQLRDTWEYPTEEQLAERKQNLINIGVTADKYLRGKYSDRWALLKMRANMLQEKHQENISFWTNNANRIPQGAIKEHMRNIYAGALLHTGHKKEAYNIYAEQNDQQSLLWNVRKMTNLAGIKQLCEEDVNSPVLNYLVQTYVNEIQETLDYFDSNNGDMSSYMNQMSWGEAYGKMSDDYMKEISDFVVFADNVAKAGGTKNPCMWESAAAIVSYYKKNYPQAKSYIDAAMQMKGTEATKQMARRVKILIEPKVNDIESAEFKKYITNELRWLDECMKKTKDIRVEHARERILNLGLSKEYAKRQDYNMSIALTALRDNCNLCYGGNTFWEMNKMKASQVEGFFNMLANPSDELQRFCAEKLNPMISEDYKNDLLGTKYLAENNLTTALNYLNKVKQDFIDNQAISFYLAHRSYKTEAWKGFVKINAREYDDDWNHIVYHTGRNTKADFCRDVISLKNTYSTAAPTLRADIAYKLATYYYQASYKGQCWAITHYSYSVYGTQNPIEADFPKIATAYLKEAAQLGNSATKTKALFGLVGVAPDSWIKGEYDSNYNLVWKVDRKSEQYAALVKLNNNLKTARNIPSFISKCDVIKKFRKRR